MQRSAGTRTTSARRGRGRRRWRANLPQEARAAQAARAPARAPRRIYDHATHTAVYEAAVAKLDGAPAAQTKKDAKNAKRRARRAAQRCAAQGGTG